MGRVRKTQVICIACGCCILSHYHCDDVYSDHEERRRQLQLNAYAVIPAAELESQTFHRNPRLWTGLYRTIIHRPDDGHSRLSGIVQSSTPGGSRFEPVPFSDAKALIHANEPEAIQKRTLRKSGSSFVDVVSIDMFNPSGYRADNSTSWIGYAVHTRCWSLIDKVIGKSHVDGHWMSFIRAVEEFWNQNYNLYRLDSYQGIIGGRNDRQYFYEYTGGVFDNDQYTHPLVLIGRRKMLTKFAPLPVLHFQYQAGHYIVERGQLDDTEDAEIYDDEVMRIQDRFSRYVFIQKRNARIINAAALTNTMADPYHIPEISRVISSSVSSSLFTTAPQRPEPLCDVPQEVIILMVENCYDLINEGKLAVLDLRNMMYAFGWKLSDTFWKRRLDFSLIFELQQLQKRQNLDQGLHVDWQRICLGIEALYTKQGWFDSSGLKNRARTYRIVGHIKKAFSEFVIDEADKDTTVDELFQSEAMMEDSQADTQTDTSTDMTAVTATDTTTTTTTDTQSDEQSEPPSSSSSSSSSSTIGQSQSGSESQTESESEAEPQLPSTQQSQALSQAGHTDPGDDSDDDELFLDLLLHETPDFP